MAADSTATDYSDRGHFSSFLRKVGSRERAPARKPIYGPVFDEISASLVPQIMVDVWTGCCNIFWQIEDPKR